MTTLTKKNVPEMFSSIKKVLQSKRLMNHFARETKITRVNLYRMLDNKNKPSYDRFLDILDAAGYEVTITKK